MGRGPVTWRKKAVFVISMIVLAIIILILNITENGYFLLGTVPHYSENVTGFLTVLYWNPPEDLKPETLNRRKCFRDKCRLTMQKSDITKADAVVFKVQHLYKLPTKQRGQVWVFFTLESPAYCSSDMTKWDNKFNWTWTYRRDSDIVSTYGTIRKRSMPRSNSDVSSILSAKSKNVLWIVSHCNTIAKRELYVNQLKSSSSVDIFGKCGRRLCSDVHTDCRSRFLNGSYRFYLSFENSHCRDYATEKILYVLRFNIIPIVRGGYNTSMFLPQDSFIDADDFNQPSLLSHHLNILSSDDRKYANYFKWRRDYEAHFRTSDDWCDLCSRLHNESRHRKLYKSVHNWWRGDDETGGKMCNSQAATLPQGYQILAYFLLFTLYKLSSFVSIS